MLFLQKNFLVNGLLLSFMFSNSFAQEALNQSNKNTALTLEQYQQCQARSEHSNQWALKLQEQQSELEQMKKQIAELTEQRDELGQVLDLHNMQSVDQYNSVNQKLNNRVSIYETEAKNYNQSVKEYRREVEALKQECNGRPISEK